MRQHGMVMAAIALTGITSYAREGVLVGDIVSDKDVRMDRPLTSLEPEPKQHQNSRANARWLRQIAAKR